MDRLLKIGDVKFGMDGPAFEEFTRVRGKEWASQPRIGRKNALQITGDSEQTISLTGVVRGLFNGLGIGQIEKLNEAMDKEQPLLVIDGTGFKYGYFVITEVSETKRKFIMNGAPQEQAFTISLKEYGEDQLQPDAVMDNDSSGMMDMRVNGNMA